MEEPEHIVAFRARCKELEIGVRDLDTDGKAGRAFLVQIGYPFATGFSVVRWGDVGELEALNLSELPWVLFGSADRVWSAKG